MPLVQRSVSTPPTFPGCSGPAYSSSVGFVPRRYDPGYVAPHKEAASGAQAWRPRWDSSRSMRLHGWGGGKAQSRDLNGAAGETGKKNVHVPDDEGQVRRPPRRQTMFFLDWDDTLFPTTHLRTTGCITSAGAVVGAAAPALMSELAELENEVCKLLEQALALDATVCVVTNASEGWVQSSASRFAPRVLKMLEARRIRVRHARTSASSVADEDEGGGVLNPARWKADVFWEELAPLRWKPPSPRKEDEEQEDSGWTVVDPATQPPLFAQPEQCEPRSVRIISIGDSQWERTAASVVGRQGDVIVTVKLAASPSCGAVRQQLRRIRQALPQLHSASKSASINAVAQRQGGKVAKKREARPRPGLAPVAA